MALIAHGVKFENGKTTESQITPATIHYAIVYSILVFHVSLGKVSIAHIAVVSLKNLSELLKLPERFLTRPGKSGKLKH
jgi:hypothetical protein